MVFFILIIFIVVVFATLNSDKEKRSNIQSKIKCGSIHTQTASPNSKNLQHKFLDGKYGEKYFLQDGTVKYKPHTRQQLENLLFLSNVKCENIDVSLITDMSFLFQDQKYFNEPIGNWNVSNVTNMAGMFDGASSFNQPIKNWNVSNVKDMALMFRNAKSFNQAIGNWNVSEVTSMTGMFNGAKSFDQPLENWNVSNVTDMSEMFFNATSFNQPIGNWDVSNVRDMSCMFFNAKKFNQPIGNWDVSNVTNDAGMFYNARSFNHPIDKRNKHKNAIVNKTRTVFSTEYISEGSTPSKNNRTSCLKKTNILSDREIAALQYALDYSEQDIIPYLEDQDLPTKILPDKELANNKKIKNTTKNASDFSITLHSKAPVLTTENQRLAESEKFRQELLELCIAEIEKNRKSKEKNKEERANPSYIDIPTIKIDIPTTKIDYDFTPTENEICNYLKEKNISCLYHFTDINNLDSISKLGGLFPRKQLKSMGVNSLYMGGNELSVQLDIKNNLTDYVRLSFCSNLPMMYRLRYEGHTLALLKIRLSIITPETLIANMNANSNSCNIEKGMLALRNLNYDAINQQYMPDSSTPEYEFRQAEVLVRKVELKDIMNIDSPEILPPMKNRLRLV